MSSNRLWRFCSWMFLIRALTLSTGILCLPEEAESKEFWFEAQELGKEEGTFEMGETEVWLPTAVVIDQKADLDEPLWFVVQNPTSIDHEFAVGGFLCWYLKKRRSPR